MIEGVSTTRTRLADHIQQLAAFPPTAFPVLSLYLDLVPYQHDHAREAAFVRAALADRVNALHPYAPERESLIADILARKTSMLVLQVEDGMLVEPNHVFVIRPGHILPLRAGAHQLTLPDVQLPRLLFSRTGVALREPRTVVS